MKLREERDRLAYDWSEEYAECASSAKQSGARLGTLRAEYVHRYNRLLEREKQPHSDFFVNLSEDIEDELDFNEDRPADLSQYDQYFEWDEAEYMKLRFTAARHYGQGPSKKETQKQKIPTKSGETGSADPRLMGGMAPGGGERLHHQVGEVLQTIEEMMNQMRKKTGRMTLMKKLYR